MQTFKNWINFAIGQTANVETSDDKRLAAIEIVERCEARDREAIESRSRNKFDLTGLRGD